MKNKKRVVIIVLVIIILGALLFPANTHLKDGGTIQYRAIVYNIEKVHRMVGDDEYEDGVIVSILGIEVFNTIK